jgi:metal-responsive CopG/Arc/MetJ family transcriptional regulator
MSSTESGEYVRIAIDIPADTLRNLDTMKDYAGYASRGRTIQAMVDAVLEMRFDVMSLDAANKNFSATVPNLQKMNQVEQAGAFMLFFSTYLNSMSNLKRKITRFVKAE